MKGEEMAVRIICNNDIPCQVFGVRCITCPDVLIIPLEPLVEGQKQVIE